MTDKFDISKFAHYKFWVPNKTADQLTWVTKHTDSPNNVIALIYIIDFVYSILKQQKDGSKNSFKQDMVSPSSTEAKVDENTKS